MKQHLVGFLFALSPLLLSGCESDVPVPEEPEITVCPGPVAWEITLTTDWADRTEGIAVPDSYTVAINNQSLTYAAATNTLPLLSEGTYPTLVYNTAEKITVSGTIATVATAGDTVDSTPGWFFASNAEIVVVDSDSSITAAMQQQIRQLTIELTVTEGDATRITSTTATLSGIANTLDIATNTHSGSGLKIVPTFVRTDNKLIATARLIGITTTEAQVLTLTITLDNAASQQITSDISSTMAGFNADKPTPLFLSADLAITPPVVTPPVTPPTEPEPPVTPPAEPKPPVTPPAEPEPPVTPPAEPEPPVTPPAKPKPPVTPPAEPKPPVTPPTEPEPSVTPPAEPKPPVTPPAEPEPPVTPPAEPEPPVTPPTEPEPPVTPPTEPEPPVTPPTEPEPPVTPPAEPEPPVTPPTEPEPPVTPPTEPEPPVTPPTEPEPPVTPPTEPEPPVTPPTEPEPPVTPPTEPEPPVTPPTEPEPPITPPVISESDFSATINNWQTGAGRTIEVK